MVRETKSLFKVAVELDLGLTAKQCEDLLLNAEFQATYRGEKYRYYRELAQDPNRSKQSNIGSLLYCADELIKEGKFDKAANVLMSVMKAEGQLEDKSTINVFGDVSAKDLALMRERVKKEQSLAN